MVKVPSYLPQQTQGGLQIPKAQPIEPGASANIQSVLGLGAKALSIYGQYKEEADNARVEEAFNQLRTKQGELTYGEKGAFRVQGANVQNVDGKPLTVAYGEMFNHEAEVIGGQLTSAQRTKFQRLAGRAQMEFGDQLRRHEANQNEVYLKQTDEASIAKEYDYIGMGNWSQPDSVAQSLQRVRFVAERSARRAGLPSEAIPLTVKEAESGLHATVLNKMLENRDPQSAKKYYEANKDQITEKDGRRIAPLIMRDAQAKQVNEVTDRLVRELGPQVDGDAFELDKILEQAREELSEEPEVLKDVSDHIKDRMNIYNAAVKSRKSAVSGPMWQGIVDGKINSITQLRNNPSWTKLDDQDQRQMINWVQGQADRWEHKAGEGDWKKGAKLWMDLTDDPRKLRDMDPNELWASASTLGRSQTLQLIKLQRDLQAKSINLENVKLDDKIIKETLASESGFLWLEKSPSKWNQQNWKDYADLKGYVEKRVGDVQGDTLQKLEPEEVRKMLKGAASEVLINKKPGWSPNVKLPRYRVNIDVMRQMFKEDPSFREKVYRKAKARTIVEPTEVQLFEVFQAGDE